MKQAIRNMEAMMQLCLPANQETPWPTLDAIERLLSFSEEMLRNDYDGDEWEQLREAAVVVRAAISTPNYEKEETEESN